MPRPTVAANGYDHADQVGGPMQSENPVATRQRDSMSRYEAAHRLVRELYRSVKWSEGTAFGLFAPYGWGKTSFLNLIEIAVGEFDTRSSWDGAPRPLIIWFNPLWFLNRQDLLRPLLGEVTARLSERARLANGESLLEVIEAFRAIVSGLKPFLGLAGVDIPDIPIDPLQTARQGMERRREEMHSIATLRGKATEALRRSGTQIWVFVDDIERLQPDEATSFLAVLRTIGDLPWLRFFLAYDRDKLIALIQLGLFRGITIQGTYPARDAEEYLKKFVPIEFDLVQLLDPGASRARTPLTELLIAARNLSIAPVAEVVTRFAVAEFATSSLESPSQRIAWIRTFIDGPSIATPREFKRAFNRRVARYWFEGLILEQDISVVVEAARRGLLDRILASGADVFAEDIEHALLFDGRGKAMRWKRHFRSAWAERTKVSAEQVQIDVLKRREAATEKIEKPGREKS